MTLILRRVARIVARLRREAEAKQAHADLLEAWGRSRRRARQNGLSKGFHGR